MIRIEHDAATGEIKEIELTEKEIKDLENLYAKTKTENDLLQAEAKAKATAKADLLAKLGITADEAKLLLN